METTSTVSIPFTLIISAFGLLVSAIVAMAIYIVSSHKSTRRETKENLTTMTNALIGNSESHTVLSGSIERSSDRQERIAQETQKLFMSLTEKILELKNGKHGNR